MLLQDGLLTASVHSRKVRHASQQRERCDCHCASRVPGNSARRRKITAGAGISSLMAYSEGSYPIESKAPQERQYAPGPDGKGDIPPVGTGQQILQPGGAPLSAPPTVPAPEDHLVKGKRVNGNSAGAAAHSMDDVLHMITSQCFEMIILLPSGTVPDSSQSLVA